MYVFKYIHFRLIDIMKQVEHQMIEHGEKLNRIQQIVEQVVRKQRESGEQHHNINMFKSFVDTILIIIIVFSVQYFLNIWHNDPTKN